MCHNMNYQPQSFTTMIVYSELTTSVAGFSVFWAMVPAGFVHVSIVKCVSVLQILSGLSHVPKGLLSLG